MEEALKQLVMKLLEQVDTVSEEWGSYQDHPDDYLDIMQDAVAGLVDAQVAVLDALDKLG